MCNFCYVMISYPISSLFPSEPCNIGFDCQCFFSFSYRFWLELNAHPFKGSFNLVVKSWGKCISILLRYNDMRTKDFDGIMSNIMLIWFIGYTVWSLKSNHYAEILWRGSWRWKAKKILRRLERRSKDLSTQQRLCY